MNTAATHRDPDQPVVFLHGWGYGPAVWGNVPAIRGNGAVQVMELSGYGHELLDPYTLEALAADVSKRAPEKCAVVAWSLGGQVAMQWALSAVTQVSSLALIAATPCFVERDGWEDAMSREVFDAFARDTVASPADTLDRFAILAARGDGRAREVRRAMRTARDPMPSPAALCAGLDVLRSADLRACMGRIACPTIVIHGECDSLVPIAAARHLAGAMPKGRLVVVPGAGHAPFISRPEAMADLLTEFWNEQRSAA